MGGLIGWLILCFLLKRFQNTGKNKKEETFPMRNLKKFLALVLAMVMAMSLMVTANAATKSSEFPGEDIDPDLVEAVDVLAGLKVFQGQNASGTENGDKVFAPKTEITRSEVAALIYRVFSTDVGDTKTHLYKDYANFTDVNPESWYAGYVGLCANHGIIKGSAGKFYPDYKVTGYEVLAMILRVVGYDEEGEFTGSGWQTRVASMASKLHITDNLNDTNYAGTLNKPATREVVAELIFQAMVRVPQVTHDNLGYDDGTRFGGTNFNPNLGWEKFGLWHDEEWSVIDDWGNPGYDWNVYNGPHDMETPYQTLNGPLLANNSTTVATIKAEPTQYYNTADIHECDVAADLHYDGSRTFQLFVNGNKAVTDAYRIEATDTVTRVGGQGRETKVYYGISSPFAGPLVNVVTMVDTYLAKVTRVTKVVKDHNGHVVQDAQLYMDVYDRGEAVLTASGDNNMPDVPTTPNDDTKLNFINDDGTRCTNLTNGKPASIHIKTQKSDFTYAVGDYLLVRGYTDKTQNKDNRNDAATIEPPGVNTGLYHKGSQEALEKTAFETNMLSGDDTKLQIVKAATGVQAKQSNVTWNTGSHTVGGEVKPDAMTLYMDYAGRNLSNTFTWYYDQFNNIIGIGLVSDNVKYGVITRLWSSFKQGDSATTGDAVAMADVTYADGTKGTVAIDTFFTAGAIGGRDALRADTYGTAMREDTDGSNTVELNPVYDYNYAAGMHDVMTATDTNPPYNPNGRHAVAGGDLYVAPVADINDRFDKQVSPYFGIIGHNMFKFITTESGVVTAVEVGGNAPGTATDPGAVDNQNSLFYDGHYHFQTTAAVGGTANPNKLNKAQGHITTNVVKAGGTYQPVWLDANVKIILNVGGSLKVYNGLSALPSDITIEHNSEVDWVDVNGDLRADYVYLFGETTGIVTYGLFYYNGGAASWNGTQGTLAGWLNGEQTTLTFTDHDEFDIVLNSQQYRGHLFAVRLMDGIVEDVMREDDNSSNNASNVPQLLYADTAPYPGGGNVTNTSLDDFKNKIVHSDVAKNNVKFVTGVAGGNPYDDNTAAVYHEDKTPSTGNGTTVTYTRIPNGNQFFGTVSVDTDDNTSAFEQIYYVGANTKIFGIGTGVTYGEAVLEYLEKSTHNWVTIVYDKLSNGILEIYVATDPNVTPWIEPDSDYINDLALTTPDYGTSNAGKWTVRVTSAAKLDHGTEYTYATMVVEKLVGETWQTATSRSVTGGTDFNLAAATGKPLVSDNASTPLTGTYRVTVTYYNSSDNVVARGSVSFVL